MTQKESLLGSRIKHRVTEVITQRVEEQNYYELSSSQSLGSVTDGFGHY